MSGYHGMAGPQLTHFFKGCLAVKSMSLQSLYPFSGSGELPDILFRMGKYSVDLQVTVWSPALLSLLDCSQQWYCYLRILQLRLWSSPCALRLSSK